MMEYVTKEVNNKRKFKLCFTEADLMLQVKLKYIIKPLTMQIRNPKIINNCFFRYTWCSFPSGRSFLAPSLLLRSQTQWFVCWSLVWKGF